MLLITEERLTPSPDFVTLHYSSTQLTIHGEDGILMLRVILENLHTCAGAIPNVCIIHEGIQMFINVEYDDCFWENYKTMQ